MANRQSHKRRKTVKREPGTTETVFSTGPPQVIDLTGED